MTLSIVRLELCGSGSKRVLKFPISWLYSKRNSNSRVVMTTIILMRLTTRLAVTRLSWIDFLISNRGSTPRFMPTKFSHLWKGLTDYHIINAFRSQWKLFYKCFPKGFLTNVCLFGLINIYYIILQSINGHIRFY